MPKFSIASPSFKNGEIIPKEFSYKGGNKSPKLEIHNVPKEAVSLVLIMEDPDVPFYVREDGLWVHWIVYNISPTTVAFEENAKDFGLLGKNTENEPSYMGPAPPDKEHRYFFRLYALDCMLSLPQYPNKKDLQSAMKDHIIAETYLMGRFSPAYSETKG